jgi:hypothetical protein
LKLIATVSANRLNQFIILKSSDKRMYKNCSKAHLCDNLIKAVECMNVWISLYLECCLMSTNIIFDYRFAKDYDPPQSRLEQLSLHEKEPLPSLLWQVKSWFGIICQVGIASACTYSAYCRWILGM